MTSGNQSSACRESRLFLVPLSILLLALLAGMGFFPEQRLWLGVPVLLVTVLIFFILYFFRDPQRALPADPSLIVSAADGIVVTVEEMEEPDFHLGPMIRIAVFLSVFDVHVNRSPVQGKVKSTVHRPGKFLDARHLEASSRNECRSWWLETERGPIAVRQIAGLIARRIVAWAGDGSALARGERMGMIRFGSRTEVFVPLGSTILVKPGDRVAGASTPIARWPGAK